MWTSATIVGRLTADPELKDAKGADVVNFSLASNRKVKGEEVTDYYDVVAWRDNAKNLAAYKHKGDLLLVSGPLEMQRWEQEGQKRSKIVLNAYQIQFLPSKNDAKNGNAGTNTSSNEDDFDDIPF